MENRNATDDHTYDSANAIKQHKVVIKCDTITHGEARVILLFLYSLNKNNLKLNSLQYNYFIT